MKNVLPPNLNSAPTAPNMLTPAQDSLELNSSVLKSQKPKKSRLKYFLVLILFLVIGAAVVFNYKMRTILILIAQTILRKRRYWVVIMIGISMSMT